MYHKLNYSAPNRETVLTENGFASQRWTPEGALECVNAGGWFGSDSQHDFAPGVGAFAREAQTALEYLMRSENHANTH